MTSQEAMRLVSMMQANWRGFAEDDVAVELWLRKLEQLDARRGTDAVQSMIESSRFPPTIAAFNDVLQEINMYELSRRPAIEPSPGKRTPEVAEAAVAQIRETLAHARGPLAESLRHAVETDPAA